MLNTPNHIRKPSRWEYQSTPGVKTSNSFNWLESTVRQKNNKSFHRKNQFKENLKLAYVNLHWRYNQMKSKYYERILQNSSRSKAGNRFKCSPGYSQLSFTGDTCFKPLYLHLKTVCKRYRLEQTTNSQPSNVVRGMIRDIHKKDRNTASAIDRND